jgi:feruloyl-CoA synthase
VNLYDVLESTVRRHPDHPALEWDAESLTYTQLRDAACRAATVFADHGVLPGDRVMVMTLNDPGFVIAMYGLWRCGAVLVPVNHKMTPPEIAQIAEHSRPVFGVVSDRLEETAREGAPDIVWLTTGREPGSFEDAVAEAAAFTGPVADETDYAQVLYTSGSTGNPKGCVMTHRAVSSIAPNTVSNMPFTPDERMLICMPVWHASPLNNWLMTTLFIGGGPEPRMVDTGI